MAKARIKGGGCCHGRMRPKRLGKGSATVNRRVKKTTKKRVYLNLRGFEKHM